MDRRSRLYFAAKMLVDTSQLLIDDDVKPIKAMLLDIANNLCDLSENVQHDENFIDKEVLNYVNILETDIENDANEKNFNTEYTEPSNSFNATEIKNILNAIRFEVIEDLEIERMKTDDEYK